MAAELVAEKRRWIERALLKTELARAAVVQRSLTSGALLPVLDSAVRLRVVTGRSRSRVRLSQAVGMSSQLQFEQVAGRPDLIVDCPCPTIEVSTADGAPDQVREALARWYRATARREIGQRLDATAALHRARYNGLSIRGQKTRWASCSAAGKMSFNWRLMLAPSAVLNYVIEHEIAHLEVMDHSDRFWRLVAERIPGFEAERRWLRENGDTLLL